MDLYRMAFIFCPDYIKKYIKDNKKIITNEISLSVKNLINQYNQLINKNLYESGKLCLDEYKLHDANNKIGLGSESVYLIMAIAIGNPLYTEKSIKKSLNSLFKESNKHKSAMIKEFIGIIKYKNKNINYSSKQSGPAGW